MRGGAVLVACTWLAALAGTGCSTGSGGAQAVDPGVADATDAGIETSDDAAPDAADVGDATADAEVAPPSTVDLVDPRIGTGGHGWWAGNAFVGASAPFGMVQAGPDSTSTASPFPWNHCSGYSATDDVVLAFSNTHLHATGMVDGGAVGFMPVPGPMTQARLATGGCSSHFDHSTEVAEPGYYAVTLADHGIRAEMTAADVAAYYRFTAVGTDAPARLTVIVDVSHTMLVGVVMDGGVTVHADVPSVDAWAFTQSDFSSIYGGMRTYVAARFDRQPAAWGTFDDGVLAPSVASQSGRHAGAWFEFDVDDGSPVGMQVGVSFVDAAGAHGNLAAGMPSWGFDGARKRAQDAWEAELSKVRFDGGSADRRKVMATALYHTMLMPNRFTDAGGTYMGFDGQAHQAGDRLYYSNFSLWDTYRTEHPLLILIEPERQRDMVASLLRMYQQGGCVPRWPYGVGETKVMIGTPADEVFAESVIKGVPGLDAEALYQAARVAATGPLPAGTACGGREGIEDYVPLGYVASDHHKGSVSRTLEYAYSDDALAGLAAFLGHADDAAMFAARAGNWRNLWDDGHACFVPRQADGTTVADVDPLAISVTGDSAYTEGNPLQYRWLVPHDMAGLRDAFGSGEAMTAALDAFFQGAVTELATVFQGDHDDLWWMTTPPQYYWHGNEPDIHTAYMYLGAGRPDLAQKWVRWIEDTLYTTAPTGLPGNDDCGTLSAWYVFSALGFYPVAGTDTYLVGAPLFSHAEVTLAGGTLVIDAPAAGPDAPYVQSVTLNGHALAVPWFHHADIAAGGTIHFEMGATPSAWGVVQ